MSSRSIRRKYGQNYLIDKAILFEMANHVSAKENDSFIEICLLYTSPSPRDLH